MSPDLTPRQRHKIDTSHYGSICSRCSYLFCMTCGVECLCPRRTRTFTLWLQAAVNETLAQLADASPPTTGRAAINAGRSSLTVQVNDPDGVSRRFRVIVEPLD